MRSNFIVNILDSGHADDLSGELLLVHFEQERRYSAGCLFCDLLELSAALALVSESDNVAYLNSVGRNVYSSAVYEEMTVSSDLTGISSCESIAHSVDNAVKS